MWLKKSGNQEIKYTKSDASGGPAGNPVVVNFYELGLIKRYRQESKADVICPEERGGKYVRWLAFKVAHLAARGVFLGTLTIEGNAGGKKW